MSRLDLSKPADFARATLGDAAAVLQQLGLAPDFADTAEWNIQEAAYNGIIFHVFKSAVAWNGALDQVSDRMGRRKVKYMFPYKDGQTTDDLGRKPTSFTMSVLIFGNNYTKCLAPLLAAFNDPRPGKLVHPIRGTITVVVEDFEIRYRHDSKKAAALEVTFAEHNFTIGDFSALSSKNVKSAITAALAAFQAVEQVITAINGYVNLAKSIRKSIQNALASYKANYAILLANMNSTFNTGTSADIPSLIPVNQGGIQGSPQTTFPVVASPNDPFTAAPIQTINAQAPVAVAVAALTDSTNKLRTSLDAIIASLQATTDLALASYSDVLSLQETSILMQSVLEQGVISSNAQVLDYVTPQLMSVREVAFANGLTPDDSIQIQILNPNLESYNFITQGTTVKVPIS